MIFNCRYFIIEEDFYVKNSSNTLGLSLQFFVPNRQA
jgi:hypothetical protein